MATLDNYREILNKYKNGLAQPIEALETALDSGGTVADGSISNAKLATDVKVGSLAALTTTEKSSVVGAVNELDSDVGTNTTSIGTLASLTTTEKTNLVGAINEIDAKESTIQNGTPVNAVAATGALTISGVVIDGETVTIDSDIYEFAADAAQTVTGGNTAVDITSYVTASQGTLTVDTNPTAADTMTIGVTVYTFVENPPLEAGEIAIGVDVEATQLNIVAAINGTDGVNTAHPLVSAGAFATNASVITALVGGVSGDSIATTETFTAGTNIFDAATLGTTTAGVDCSAANAVTALVAADIGTTYSLADGTGDVVDVTATTAGVSGNSIATTETMANGAFAAATLENGVDGTVGIQWETRVDASYIYVCTATNTIADANWKRSTISTY